MDKSYKKVYILILLIILICFMCWGIKDFRHRREIKRLLTVEPVTYSVIKDDSNQSNYKNNAVNMKSQSIYEEYSDTVNEEDDEYNSNKKEIRKSSSKIEQKIQKGTDFINELDEIKESNDIENEAKSVNSNEFDNVQLLARLIQSEAGDEPYDGKIAVGNVVLNRARENSQSIESVIYAKNQFDGVQTSNFRREPDKECIKAAQEVLNGKEITDSYYFVNLNYASPSWAKESTFETRIGEHWFFRKE